MKLVASVHDQKEPSRQPSGSAQGKKVLNKKPAIKSRQHKIPQSPTLTTADPSLLSGPPTNGNVVL